MNAGATSTDFAKAFYTNNARGVLANCEFVDYASNDPSFILAPNNLTMAKSTNWGDTFSNSGPPTRFNRNVCAAAASSTNWVATGFAFDEANNRPQYTTDGGASWNDSAGSSSVAIRRRSSSPFVTLLLTAALSGTFYGFAEGRWRLSFHGWRSKLFCRATERPCSFCQVAVRVHVPSFSSWQSWTLHHHIRPRAHQTAVAHCIQRRWQHRFFAGHWWRAHGLHAWHWRYEAGRKLSENMGANEHLQRSEFWYSLH